MNFTEKLELMTNRDLVTTIEKVSGKFYIQQKEMNPKMKETATDLDSTKIELLNRLARNS